MGSSLAFTIPSMFVKINELEKGTSMKVYYGLDGILIVASDDNQKKMLVSLLKLC